MINNPYKNYANTSTDTLQTSLPPILTVLVLTYNHEDTLDAALDSVLNQKTTYKYEIWIAEDCSTDKTLQICRKYLKKYPSQIKLFAQPVNTKLRHFREVLCKIDTEYLTIVEGDDRWSDNKKIQTAIDILERNPKYVTFAHDTLYDDAINKTKKSLVHDIHQTEVNNPVSLLSAPYLHTSARVHRNALNLKAYLRKLPDVRDIHLFYGYLDQGPLYYHDQIMSVYNINNKGVWNKLSAKDQAIQTEAAYRICNSLLHYKYDLFFTKKVSNIKLLERIKRILGVRLGWMIYIWSIKKSF